VLRGQLLHQPVSNQFVVFGRAQALRHRLEGQQKAGEVPVIVDRARLFNGELAAAVLDIPVAIIGRGQRGVVTPAEFGKRLGIDRTLEMKMQFGFGKGKNEVRAVGRQLLAANLVGVILSAAKDLLFLAPKDKSRFFAPVGRSE
jgi:hypothetical protein